MLEKLLYSKSKIIATALKHINLTPATIHKTTQLASYASLIKKYNPKAPALTDLLKHLKAEEPTI